MGPARHQQLLTTRRLHFLHHPGVGPRVDRGPVDGITARNHRAICGSGPLKLAAAIVVRTTGRSNTRAVLARASTWFNSRAAVPDEPGAGLLARHG